jgi:hypothetical protein
LINYFILIMSKLSSSKLVDSEEPMFYWNNFKKTDLEWLTNFYKRQNFSTTMITDTIERRKKHDEKLEGLIKNAEKNQGEYFRKFM